MIRVRSVQIVCAVLLFSTNFVMPSAVLAQTSAVEELTRVLPDDVLGFVATSGGESLKPGFEKSILGRIWNDQGVVAFAKSLEQAIMPMIKQHIGDSDAPETIDEVLGYAKLGLGRPIIVGAARKQGGEGPPVYGFAILNAGPRKAEIVAALSKLESLADEGDIVDITVGSARMHAPKAADDVPLYWGWIDNYLVAAVNDGAGLAVKYLSAPRAAVPACLRTVPGTDDAIVAYYDIQSTINIVSTVAFGMGHAPGEVDQVKAVLTKLGLGDIKSVTARVGFAGPDVVSNSLVEMPSPRSGLFANLKSVDMRAFDMVDAGAMNATAFNCDLGGMYDTVLGAIKTAAGDEFAEVEQGIAAVESQLKFKIRQGLLQSLSGQMVIYTLPSGASAQSPMGGFVLIAGLRDRKLWEESLNAIGEFAAAVSEGMVQVSSQELGGRTVHTWAIVPLAVAQIMPTWTIVGDSVVIGSSPAVCSGAVDQISSGTKSIRSTEGFRMATAELPANLISLRYSNSKLQFTQLMTALQQFWPMATMFAARAELKLPMILPNLSHIAQDMGSGCQYSWFDERGLRSRYRGPGVEPSLGGVAGVAIGMGVMMPAMARARGQARSTVSMSNLKQIGLVLTMYGQDNGKLPETIEQAKEYYHDSKILESPLKPTGFNGPSYIYIQGHSLGGKSPARQIVVYENPEYLSDKISVLFLDAHVERMTRDSFLEALEATYKELGREMPEIRFNR